MSELIIQPTTIEAIKPHPNADRLEIAVVGGWEIVTGKDNYSVGDTVVHIQPESMVPRAWADTWSVTQYLSWKKEVDVGRVRCARLRGITSFGFLVPNESGAALGTDLSEHYGIVKYDPPQHLGAGKVSNEHPLFHRYTNIENLRNHKNSLDYDQELIVTEKLHGTNSRIGWVRLSDDEEFECVIGTHKTQRDSEDCGMYGLPLQLHADAFEKLFEGIADVKLMGDQTKSIIVFGEIYGAGVQDLHYGAKQEKGYRVFDISVDGQYMPWDILQAMCRKAGLPTVPVLDYGIFNFEQLVEFAQGNTTMDDEHVREGIVVRPRSKELTWNNSRMVFKLISDGYMLRKGGSEMH
jgi:RNA ligase (TIGR02306 family)